MITRPNLRRKYNDLRNRLLGHTTQRILEKAHLVLDTYGKELSVKRPDWNDEVNIIHIFTQSKLSVQRTRWGSRYYLITVWWNGRKVFRVESGKLKVYRYDSLWVKYLLDI
jgi:hypothetical protein